MSSISESGGSTPAFLMKLWNLLETRDYQDLISWDSGGKSFHIHDQSRLARQVLPHFFKHNKMSSFVRQLNMYGFRKVAAIDQGALKVENDEVEFANPYFQREHPELLSQIKRRQTQTAHSDRTLKLSHEDLSAVLADVTAMRKKQADYDAQIENLQKQNRSLWGEMAALHNKHQQLQCVLRKLAQFLVGSMQRNPTLGANLKRKFSSQLMLGAAPASADEPAAKRQHTDQAAAEDLMQDIMYKLQPNMEQALLPAKNGPIIHDVTDQLQSRVAKAEEAQSCQQAASSPSVETVQSPPSNGTLPYSPLIDLPTSPFPTPALSPNPALSPSTLLGEELGPSMPLPLTQTPPPPAPFVPPPTLPAAGKDKEEEQDVLLPSDCNALALSPSYKDVRDYLNNMEMSVNTWKDLFGSNMGFNPDGDFMQSLFSGDSAELPQTDLSVNFDNADDGQGYALAQLSGGDMGAVLDDLPFSLEDEEQKTDSAAPAPFNPNDFLQ